MRIINCKTKIIKTGVSLLCADFGTSFVKTLLLDSGGCALNKYDYSQFPYEQIGEHIIDNRLPFVVSGARADLISDYTLPPPAFSFSEIDCLSRLARRAALERAVIVCVGTGTPFIVYENGRGVHFGGTGVGGGTFRGLSKRLLGITDPAMTAALAVGGNICNINITIGELNKKGGISYLKNDFTAANFAKTSGGSQNDIALGIHSLVSETIGMMAAQIAKARGIGDVIFCGAVLDNRIILKTLENCLDLFGLNTVFVESPGFGVCFGAADLYCDNSRLSLHNAN